MTKLIAVDLQYDFTRRDGKHYNPQRASIDFIRGTFIPFLAKKKLKIGEIISDYRQPRPGDPDESCWPGTWGYKSEIPEKLVETRWIKCLNSPLYTRKNIGVENGKPGLPRIDGQGFYLWLSSFAIRGVPPLETTIILVGLTLDCCVLCTAQAIRFAGYNVKIIMEGTDTYSGNLIEKSETMRVVRNWAEEISWDKARRMLTK